jgi:DNA-binding transcriptional MerR regulator
VDKAPDAFRTISEVAEEIDIPQHVLRFWESRFTQIRPLKRGGGRRYYRPEDVDLLRGVRHLLYGEGYTIRGVQRILREQGLSFVQSVWRAGAEPPPPELPEDEAGDADVPTAAAIEPAEEPSLFALPIDAPSGEAPTPPARREPTFIPPAAVAPASGRLGADGEARRKLRTALDELVACQRLLEAALSERAGSDD